MNLHHRLTAALAASLLASGSPLLAQPAAGDGARADMRMAVREIADMTAGHPIATGAADKLLFISGDGADLRIVGIQALALGGEWPALPAGATAAIRTRASAPAANSQPDPADIAFVLRTGTPVYLVGEWSRPAAVWEIRKLANAIFYRELGSKGAPGPWQPAQR